MSSTDVALRPEEQAVHGLELAERVFTPERRTAIAQFLNVAPEDPVLVPYLAVCASYGLDPIMGHVWLIPQRVKVRDGEAESWQDRYRPAVGRDGYLAVAHRDSRFAGLQSGVVCEHDTFEVAYEGDPLTDPTVLHRYASKPTISEDGEDMGRYRGRVLGAWAKCYIKDGMPTFYFASLREHGRREQAWEWGTQRGEKTLIWLRDDGTRTTENTGRPAMQWSGAWDYVSPMILKSAQSYVLRIALGITGLVPADELGDRQQLTANSVVAPAMESAEFDWQKLDVSEELRARLRSAVEQANELAPMSWSPAKLQMVLLNRPAEELEARADEIEREVALYEQRIDPADGEPVAVAEPEPEPQAHVQEAVVVDALSEQEQRELEDLRHQEADLEAAREEHEDGSEAWARVSADLDAVRERIRPLAERAGAE